jgi:hypothetical protein
MEIREPSPLICPNPAKKSLKKRSVVLKWLYNIKLYRFCNFKQHIINNKYCRENNTLWATNDQTMNKKKEKETMKDRLNYGTMKIINDM